jgi:hypothetical protein
MLENKVLVRIVRALVKSDNLTASLGEFGSNNPACRA